MNVDKTPIEADPTPRMGEAHPTTPTNVPEDGTETGKAEIAVITELPRVKRYYRKNPDIPVGRPPTDYENMLDADTCDKIMERIACGESVRHICKDDDMPSERMFYRVLLNSETFRQKYARAKEFQTEKYNEDMVDIANDGTNDWMEREKKNGETYTVLNEEHVSRSRLRIDTLKWVMGKAKPKKYGDQPAQTNVNVGVQVGVMTEERRQSLMAKKQAAIARKSAQLGNKPSNPSRAHAERETI